MWLETGRQPNSALASHFQGHGCGITTCPALLVRATRLPTREASHRECPGGGSHAADPSMLVATVSPSCLVSISSNGDLRRHARPLVHCSLRRLLHAAIQRPVACKYILQNEEAWASTGPSSEITAHRSEPGINLTCSRSSRTEIKIVCECNTCQESIWKTHVHFLH